MPDRAPGGPARLGVYEKTIPVHDDWSRTFHAVRAAGFDFFELSIDVSAERLARLGWDERERRRVREAAADEGVDIQVLTLSAHRDWPWGSADPAVRRRAADLAARTIDLAAALGAECVQIAGYYTFQGPRAENARELFLAGLSAAADDARERSLVLAVENVDGTDIIGVDEGLGVLDALRHPSLRLYVDVGNLTGNGRDTARELVRALPHCYCVQLKDARPGVFRRVPFGEGEVPFDDVFDVLVDHPEMPVSVEMWNDDDDAGLAAEAARWTRAQWASAQVRRTGSMRR